MAVFGTELNEGIKANTCRSMFFLPVAELHFSLNKEMLPLLSSATASYIMIVALGPAVVVFFSFSSLLPFFDHVKLDKSKRDYTKTGPRARQTVFYTVSRNQKRRAHKFTAFYILLLPSSFAPVPSQHGVLYSSESIDSLLDLLCCRRMAIKP